MFVRYDETFRLGSLESVWCGSPEKHQNTHNQHCDGQNTGKDTHPRSLTEERVKCGGKIMIKCDIYYMIRYVIGTANDINQKILY